MNLNNIYFNMLSLFIALQIDLARHTLENVRLIDNALDGLGIIYSDIFSMGMSNTIKNCDMSNNRGSGVAFKQLGMKIISKKLHLILVCCNSL